MMRIVFFGSGSPYSIRALEELSDAFPVACVVIPAAKSTLRRWSRRLRGGGRGLRRVARTRGISVIEQRPGEGKCLREVRALNADLICVASYPYRLDSQLLGAVRLGGINAHPSLLPLHRGPDPLFWTYLADDRETGVTIHWIDEGVDSGDIILQDVTEIPRLISGLDLYLKLAALAAPLLVRAVKALQEGNASRTRQPPGNWESSPSLRKWRIDYDHMTIERMAHFLHGMSHRHPAEIPDRNGSWHVVGPIRRALPGKQPALAGTITRSKSFITVCLKDGSIELERPPLADRLRRVFRG